LASKAQDHTQKIEQRTQDAATKIATSRALAENQALLQQQKANLDSAQAAVDHTQEIIQTQEAHELEMQQQEQANESPSTESSE